MRQRSERDADVLYTSKNIYSPVGHQTHETHAPAVSINESPTPHLSISITLTYYYLDHHYYLRLRSRHAYYNLPASLFPVLLRVFYLPMYVIVAIILVTMTYAMNVVIFVSDGEGTVCDEHFVIFLCASRVRQQVEGETT